MWLAQHTELALLKETEKGIYWSTKWEVKGCPFPSIGPHWLVFEGHSKLSSRLMMGHIPADREWVGSSEVVAVEESTDNKSEAVDICKFTIGLAKMVYGWKAEIATKRQGWRCNNRQTNLLHNIAWKWAVWVFECVFVCLCVCVCARVVFVLWCRYSKSTAWIQCYKLNPLMADSKMMRFTPRRGWGFCLFVFEDFSDVSKCDGSPND